MLPVPNQRESFSLILYEEPTASMLSTQYQLPRRVVTITLFIVLSIYPLLASINTDHGPGGTPRIKNAPVTGSGIALKIPPRPSVACIVAFAASGLTTPFIAPLVA